MSGHIDDSGMVVIHAGRRDGRDNAALAREARDILDGRVNKPLTAGHVDAMIARVADVRDDYRKKLDEANGEIEHLRVILDERDDQIRTMLDERRNYQTLLAARDESIRNLRDLHVRDCRFIERLERANSTAMQCLADEQRERELLTAEMSEAMATVAEFFQRANELRGRGTPRSITHEPPRVAAVEA